MGTRTIIFFSSNALKKVRDDTKRYEIDYEKNKLIKRAIPIYKHWDGYPSNMLHLLNQYLNVNKGRIIDTAYIASGFLRYVENYDYEAHIPEKFTDVGDPYTGYGLYSQRITRRFLDSSWADYYYKITPSKIYVYKSYEFEDYGIYKHHPKIIWESDLDEFLELPDEREYYENLEEEIWNK